MSVGPDHHDLSTVTGDGDGVHWTLAAGADLNANLVRLGPGHAVETHVNDEVDVLVVGLDGRGRVDVDGQALDLRPHVVVLVPKGASRRIEASLEGLGYLTVHRRRGPLRIGRRREE